MAQKKRAIFGCDIGSGFAAISVLNQEGVPLPMIPERYQLLQGMASDVYVTPPEGKPLLVFDAKNGSAAARIARDPLHGVRAVKTRMKEGSVKLSGITKRIAADELYAAIARDLVTLGNEERANRGEQPVYELVLTYPASYESDLALLNRMVNSVESVRLDGHSLKVVARIPEPAAVAIDYLYYMQHQAPKEIRIQKDHYTALVYDLGCGTFDAAVVTARSKGEPYCVLSKDGLPDVGGKDFDVLLAEWLEEQLERQHGCRLSNAQEKERMIRLAQETKHALSGKDTESYVAQYGMRDGTYAELLVTRKKLEELVLPSLYRTLEVVQRLLEEAVHGGTEIDAIVLSGGASRMPVVARLLEELAQNRFPVVLYRASEAVSFGAARYAAGVAAADEPEQTAGQDETQKSAAKPNDPTAKVLEQLTGYPYGIFRTADAGIDGEVCMVVPRGAKLPASSEPFSLCSPSHRLRLRVERPLEYKSNAQTIPAAQCENIFNFYFDVQPETLCQFVVTVEEDYNITASCRRPDGAVQSRSTADELGK